jgi:hypothetical protein
LEKHLGKYQGFQANKGNLALSQNEWVSYPLIFTLPLINPLPSREGKESKRLPSRKGVMGIKDLVLKTLGIPLLLRKEVSYYPPSPCGRGQGGGGSTNVEMLLWRYLRVRQMQGLKFRRQQPIGRYIVDFVCFEKRIIIEVDGGQHAL